MKNEKFLLDIQAKCGDIANEIPNVAIDTERTFRCKWPYDHKFLLIQCQFFDLIEHLKSDFTSNSTILYPAGKGSFFIC